MQIAVDGMPALADFSTLVWQYRQSMPRPVTWCLWLNGTGWSGVRATTSQYCERAKAKAPPKRATATTSAPSATARNQVSAVLEKICGTRAER